jgi:hypothetical protein
MNREIKFRGKCTQTEEWIYGYYFHIPKPGNISQHFIQSGIKRFSVIPETVGQYTGITDRKRKEIYERDILKYDGGTKINLFEIQFMQARFKALLIGRSDDGQILGYGLWDESEVIGNIYENPELLSEPS